MENFKVILKCHPSEIFYPCNANKEAVSIQTSFYTKDQLQKLTIGDEGYITYINMMDNFNYVTYSFYFVINGAIGPISDLLQLALPYTKDSKIYKIASTFGYHGNDSVDITIKYDKFWTPLKVNYDAHARGQGMWVNWEDAPKEDGLLVCYVAHNSHALYPEPKTYYRIFGFGNDVCAKNGKQFTMKKFINLYNGIPEAVSQCGFKIQSQPSNHSITPWERFTFPLYKKRIEEAKD